MTLHPKKGQSHDVITLRHQTAASERTLIRLLNTISICPNMRRSRSDMLLSSSDCDNDVVDDVLVRVVKSDDVMDDVMDGIVDVME